MQNPQQDALGKPTDYGLRGGPKVERGCTDLICLIVFIAFTILMWWVSVFAVKNGDPRRIAIPYDPDHRACGVDAGVEDYPYIYFANPSPNYLYVTTCVKSCPDTNSSQSAPKEMLHKSKKHLTGTATTTATGSASTTTPTSSTSTTSTPASGASSTSTTSTTPAHPATTTPTTTSTTPTTSTSTTSPTTSTTPAHPATTTPSTTAPTTTTPTTTPAATPAKPATPATTPASPATPASTSTTASAGTSGASATTTAKPAATTSAAPAASGSATASSGSGKLDCFPNSIVKSCNSHPLDPNPENILIIYDTELFMNSVCLPTTKQYFETVSSELDSETLDQVSNDMIQTKWVVFSSIFCSFILSFIFLWMIEHCGGCIVWTFIVMFELLIIAAGVLSILYYYALTDPTVLPEEAQARINAKQMQQQAQAEKTDPKNYLWLAGGFFTLAVVFLLVLICMFSRIRLAIAILETACDYVQDNFSVVLLPIFVFFILFSYLIVWFVIALYLFSCGDVSNQPKQLPFGQFTFTNEVKVYANIHIFGLLWNQAFIIASTEFIIAGSVCIWYFQQGPRGQQGPAPMSTSISRYFSFHLGTVALGSFLLALVSFIRLWLAYLFKHQEELMKKNKALEVIIKCLSCCLWVFEKCIQFINKNSYIVTQMTGLSFFPAAREAVFLILRNPIRFGTVGGLGEVFVAVGRAFIGLLTGLFCYLVIKHYPDFEDTVMYPQAPAILCGIVGFGIGSIFMSVYGVACDSILLVFIMDEEMEKHNGKGIALSCPPKLEKFLEDQ